MNADDLVVFRLGADAYALRLDVVEEVVLPDRSLARTGGEGGRAVTIRERELPLVDLAEHLGIRHDVGERVRQALLLRREDEHVALGVHDVAGIFPLPTSGLITPPAHATLAAELVEGIGHVAGELVVVLRADGLLESLAGAPPG